jgi:hypothetical protein
MLLTETVSKVLSSDNLRWIIFWFPAAKGQPTVGATNAVFISSAWVKEPACLDKLLDFAFPAFLAFVRPRGLERVYTRLKVTFRQWIFVDNVSRVK